MARIDSRGLVDDGTANLVVEGSTTLSNPPKVSSTTVAGSGNVSISTVGLIFTPASGSGTGGLFTGSVPAASAWPGSTLVVTDTLGNYPWCLTGSAFSAAKAVFVFPFGLSGSNGKTQGTNLAVTAGGSVAMVSDGYYWLLMANTGSLNATGNP